eukprot:3076403-Rhodomonas_salina.1
MSSGPSGFQQYLVPYHCSSFHTASASSPGCSLYTPPRRVSTTNRIKVTGFGFRTWGPGSDG